MADEKAKSSCTPNWKFICSFEGILKVIEFFTVFLAWVLCSVAFDKIDDVHLTARYTFFIVVAIVCWVFTIFVILFNLFGCFNKCVFGRLLRVHGWSLFLLAYSLSWFFFWLSGAILLAYHFYLWNGNAINALLGFVNTILFFVDSIMYYRRCRKNRVEIRKLRRGLLDPENV